MRFERPKPTRTLTWQEKDRLLREYFEWSVKAAKSNPGALNRKVPREHFASILDQIGRLILEEAKLLSTQGGPVRQFLSDNPLPTAMRELLPDEFRAFCLLLNALKQWLSAEQAATDRFLLGGMARKRLRSTLSTCVVSGRSLREGKVELHHAVRDGRPPLPVLKEEHARLESQVSVADDPILAKLAPVKREGNRSWVLLREGLEFLLAVAAGDETQSARKNGKSFARKALSVTGTSPEQLLAWLDENELAL